MEISVDGLLAGFRRAVLPAHCLLCAQDGAAARDLCAGCAADLERNRICCPRCAVPLAAPAPLCGECLQHAPPFERAHAAFVYAHPLDILVAKLKFGRSLAAGRVLAELWLDAIGVDAPPLPEVLVPVPLHVARLRERGYNQVLELAKPLARTLGLPLAAGLLERTRATLAQTGLDAVARRRSLRGAFACAEAIAATLDRGARIALVDDVMTTGTTLRECARTLRRAGFDHVEVWALARAPKFR